MGLTSPFIYGIIELEGVVKCLVQNNGEMEMFGTKRRPSTPIDSPYGNEKIIENSEPYLKELENGNLDVIETVVLGHSRLAMKIASGYARPGIVGDLPSVAILALVEGCHNVINGHDCKGNLTGYLISVVHSKCYRFFCEDRLIRVPMSAITKVKEAPKIQHLGAHTKPQTNLKEMKETILNCCSTARERQIIRLKQFGFTTKEISGIFGISTQFISRILKRIERKYENLL